MFMFLVLPLNILMMLMNLATPPQGGVCSLVWGWVWWGCKRGLGLVERVCSVCVWRWRAISSSRVLIRRRPACQAALSSVIGAGGRLQPSCLTFYFSSHYRQTDTQSTFLKPCAVSLAVIKCQKLRGDKTALSCSETSSTAVLNLSQVLVSTFLHVDQKALKIKKK